IEENHQTGRDMEETLTRKQVRVLEIVRDFRAGSGYSPTLREIAGELGVSSVATVAGHIDSLEALGLIRRRPDRARSLLLTTRGRAILDRRSERAVTQLRGVMVPLLGTIAAGEPIEALNVPDEIEVPASLASGRGVYALKVAGESMVDEGIFDGDYVVVEEKPVPENGETVVALIDGTRATLKKFYREETADGGRIRLQPANPSMQPIILGPDDSVEIQGRVTGVLRLY
ncbi:MAG: transcriptional repressor LexA, partial [Candidatus Geothermincolia bacterium]